MYRLYQLSVDKKRSQLKLPATPNAMAHEMFPCYLSCPGLILCLNTTQERLFPLNKLPYFQVCLVTFLKRNCIEVPVKALIKSLNEKAFIRRHVSCCSILWLKKKTLLKYQSLKYNAIKLSCQCKFWILSFSLTHTHTHTHTPKKMAYGENC